VFELALTCRWKDGGNRAQGNCLCVQFGLGSMGSLNEMACDLGRLLACYHSLFVLTSLHDISDFGISIVVTLTMD